MSSFSFSNADIHSCWINVLRTQAKSAEPGDLSPCTCCNIEGKIPREFDRRICQKVGHPPIVKLSDLRTVRAQGRYAGLLDRIDAVNRANNKHFETMEQDMWRQGPPRSSDTGDPPEMWERLVTNRVLTSRHQPTTFLKSHESLYTLLPQHRLRNQLQQADSSPVLIDGHHFDNGPAKTWQDERATLSCSKTDPIALLNYVESRDELDGQIPAFHSRSKKTKDMAATVNLPKDRAATKEIGLPGFVAMAQRAYSYLQNAVDTPLCISTLSTKSLDTRTAAQWPDPRHVHNIHEDAKKKGLLEILALLATYMVSPQVKNFLFIGMAFSFCGTAHALEDAVSPAASRMSGSWLLFVPTITGLLLFEILGPKYLSLIMAAFALSFPIVESDQRTPTSLLYAVYLISLASTAAYGYASFSEHGDPQLSLLASVVLSATMSLTILMSSSDGMQAMRTFLPVVLSLSVFIVANFPIIEVYARQTLKRVWQTVRDCACSCAHAFGKCLISLSQHFHGGLQATEEDLEGQELTSTHE